MIIDTEGVGKRLRSGDLDLDGDPDLIVGGVDAISVLINDGSGRVMAESTYPVDNQARCLGAGDIDGDGDIDFVAASSNFAATDVALLVYMNQGDGTFARTQTIPLFERVTSIVVEDLDGDGDGDVCITQEFTDDSLTIWHAESDGSLGLHQSLNVMLDPSDIAAKDIDGDGDIDLAIASSSVPTFILAINDSTGTFSTVIGDDLDWLGDKTIVLGDVDDDGDIDMVMGVKNGDFFGVLRNVGDGTFDDAFEYPIGVGEPTDVELADLDQDGHLDLVASMSNQVALVALNDGTGGFPSLVFQPATFGVGNSPGRIIVGDFDGNATPDLVCGNFSNVSILFNDGSGILENQDSAPLAISPSLLFSADLNADGIADLVTTNPDAPSVELLISGPDGEYDEAAVLNATIGEKRVQASDLNADGNVDLVTTNDFVDRITFHFGEGDGSFGPANEQFAGDGPSQPLVSDLDQDGDPDVVVVSANDNLITTWLNDGNGTFVVSQTNIGQIWGQFATIADVDGDGDPDLIVSRTETSVWIATNQGDATFNLQTLSTRNPVHDVDARDFDGDGDPDLATIDPTGERTTMTLFINAGDGSFLAGPVSDLGEPADGYTFGDLDGDGFPDVVTVEPIAQAANIFRNDGQGFLQYSLAFGTGRGPVAVIMSDIDGDGDQDLATANRDSFDVSLLFNSSCRTACTGDVNQSGGVDFADLLAVLASWGPCPECVTDLDQSGDVDFTDVLTVLSAWGPCHPM